ncbi:MAG TPA: putative toxin-antitoxin system toxin component, PIN family [Candidatus Kapabacteria bacterium]
MKVVIDTNVIISAGLRGRKPKQIIDTIINSPEYEWVVSQAILDEYSEVIHRKKFHFSQEQISYWTDVFSSLEMIEDNDVATHFPRDPKDEKFLKCAFASDADYFLTGDNDFQEIEKIGNTIRISVSEFIRTVIMK